MKRIRTVVAVATTAALCSLVAVAAAAAVEPNLLGEKGQPPVKFTGSSGLGIAETVSGKKVECSSDSPSGFFEAELPPEWATKGPYKIEFKSCTSGGFKCTTSGQSTGVIILSGVFQLRWWGAATSEHKVAFRASPAEAVFTCALTELSMRGCVAGKVEPVNSGLKTTFSVIFEQTKGKQGITEVFNAGGTAKEACKLEAKEGVGVFETAGLATTEALGNFVNKQSEVITAEIMG